MSVFYARFAGKRNREIRINKDEQWCGAVSSPSSSPVFAAAKVVTDKVRYVTVALKIFGGVVQFWPRQCRVRLDDAGPVGYCAACLG